jgi:outer membrane cobalamin receptor
VRGGTSALYGADAVAGVVNIITRDRAEERFRLSLANGSYIPRAATEVYDGSTQTPVEANFLDLVDTQRIGLRFFQPMGLVDLLATASFTRARNAFVWYDAQYIDDYRRRVNAGLLEGDATLSLTVPAGSGRAGLKAQYGYSQAQAPGKIDPAWLPTDALQKLTTAQAQLFFQAPSLGSSPFSLDARLFYKYSGLGYEDPIWTTDDTHRLHTAGLDVSQKLVLADWVQAVYGANVLFDAVDSTSVGGQSRLSGGLFLEVPLYIGMLTLIPMARYDLYSDFPDSLTYKLAAVLAVSDRVSIKASGARSYRAPTMNDLYWPYEEFSFVVDLPPDPPYTYTSITTGNPGLRPETGFTGDLGLSIVTDRMEASLFAFVRYMIDGNQWVDQDPAFNVDYYLPVNIGEALFPGAEADVTLRLLPGLRLSGSYTFLYSFVLKGASADYSFADDKRAIYSPVHKGELALSYERKRIRLGVDAQFVGERFNDEANTSRLAPYVVLNAEANLALNDNLSLTLTGKNLLNQVYQTADGYVMPPLSIWVGAELRL